MGPIGFVETSVTNCRSTLRNITEERRSHLNRAGSVKSRKGWRKLQILSTVHEPCTERILPDRDVFSSLNLRSPHNTPVYRVVTFNWGF